MHPVDKLLFPLWLYLLVALPINRLCTSRPTHSSHMKENKLFRTKPLGTKPLGKICKCTLTPRVTSHPTGSYTLLRKEEEDKEMWPRKIIFFFQYWPNFDIEDGGQACVWVITSFLFVFLIFC